MFLFHKRNESLFRRMLFAKLCGFILGVAGFIWATNTTLFIAPPQFRWGILAWGITFGALIGLGGLIKECPWKNNCCLLFKNKKWRPFWRGGFLGAWLEFVLALFSYELLQEIFFSFEGMEWISSHLLLSAIVEGFFLGAIIDIIATKFGGEGKEIL